jgi:hypothetical protein
MRIALVALLGLSLTPVSVFAATPEKTAKIEHLLDVLRVQRIEDEIHTSLTQAIDRITQQIAQQAGVPAAERTSATAEVHDKMIASMKDLTSWQRLKPGMIDIYDQEYNDAQLDAIIAFFTSPVGQQYLDKSAEVQQKARDMAGIHVKETGDAVQALAKAWVEAHQPAAPPAKPAAPAPPK